MQGAVRMHDVFAAEHTGQGTLDNWVVEQLDEFRDQRQQVVAEVADAGCDFIEALEYQLMVARGQRRPEVKKAVRNEGTFAVARP